MSSNTQLHFTVRGAESIRLDRLLGARGRTALLETLESLPELRKGLDASAAAELDWQRVKGTDQFQTTIGKTLVSLNIGGQVATLSYTDQFGVTASPGSHNALAGQVAQELQRAANRKVNQLLAVAIAQRLKQQVAQYKVTNDVRMSIRQSLANKIHVRTTAKLRA